MSSRERGIGMGMGMRMGIVAALITSAGCVIPFAIPPVRAEIGGAAPIGRDGGPRLQAAVGAHLASGTLRRDQPFDVGAGYLLGYGGGGGGGGGDAGGGGGASHGVYVDGAKFIDRSRRTRTALGGRLEALRTPMGTSMGGRVRIDHEIFGVEESGFSGSHRCGITSGTRSGTIAAGAFAEVGPQWMPGGEVAWTAAAGITVRLPASLGVYIGIPGC